MGDILRAAPLDPEDVASLTSVQLEHAFDVWALEELIDDLEAEIDELRADLVDARRVRGSVAGGPPPEWDAWIQLPADLDCFGPTNAGDRTAERGRQQQRQRRAEFRRPSRAVALSAWRREMQVGQRTRTACDALWAAAAAEQQALEYEAAGLPELAVQFWADARAGLAAAAGSGAA